MKVDYETLNNKVKEYSTPSDCEAIHKAYIYAHNAHQHQYRKSGDPYIIHPLSVALILAEQKMPAPVIIAGLLHDVVEDTDVTIEDIRDYCGEEVAMIVDGVTKLDHLPSVDSDQLAAENQRKVIVASAKDVRVIIVKLADRLHNMQTISFMNENKQKRIAKETLDVYAPIAHRLGMYKIKWELEDLSFKVLNKSEYDKIAEKINMKRYQREEFVDKVVEEVEELLAKNNIDARVYGRTKHIYSIYQTMKRKNKSFEEISDLFGFRIVVKELNQCYNALGVIHSTYKPIPHSFKDYIPTPKHNLYQSIHTTVLYTNSDGTTSPIEFQIRTEYMENVAENGVASHWAYKDGEAKDQDKNLEKQLMNFKNVVEALKDKKSDKFIESLTGDFFGKTIIVYTPKGDVIELPQGSCALDFAFKIHTSVGLHAVNAIVNDKTVSLFYPLNMGDIVNIITSEVANPDLSYISRVTTHRAKDKLNQYFADVEKKQMQQQGNLVLNEIGRQLDVKELLEKDNHQFLLNLAIKFNVYEVDEFLGLIGNGTIRIKDIKNILTHQEVETEKLPDVIIDNHVGNSYILCGMCKPIPGDTIVACEYQLDNYKVHREECNYISNDYEEAHWSQTATNQTYEVNLALESKDEKNALVSILEDIANLGFKVNSAKFQSLFNGESILKLRVAVHSKEDYDLIRHQLKKNKYVQKLGRVLNENS